MHDPRADPWVLASWRAVLATQPDPHPFATPEWHRAWWEHFGAGEFAVHELRDGTRVVGVAALRPGVDGVLHALGDRRLSDYPGPVIRPDAAEAAARALAALARRAGGLELADQRPQDGLVDALADAAPAAGLTLDVTPDEPVVAMGLPGSWDAYRDALRRHDRHELARKQRRLAREHPTARVRRAEAATLAADLDAFLALHRRSRGDKASFADERTEGFLRRVSTDAMAAGTLGLDLLEADGTPLAAALGFRSPRTHHLYNMAYEPRAAAASPGIVLVAALVERAIADGLARFDFLRGAERYKLELGGAASRLVRVRLTRA